MGKMYIWDLLQNNREKGRINEEVKHISHKMITVKLSEG